MGNSRNRGIVHIIAAAFCFALMSFFVRLSGDVPSLQKSFFRNIVALFVATVLLARSKEGFRMKRGSLPYLLLRSLCGCLGLICNFYAIDRMNISDANMLNKLSPFFAVVFSAILLKEKAGVKEWGAVLIAFAGAVFVMKPSFHVGFIPALVGALGGLGAGAAYTFVRMLGKRGERGEFIVFFFSAFSTLATLPFILFDYHPMQLWQWGTLILAGAAAMGGQLNVTAAYTCAPAREISVFDYSQILFAAMLGYLFLDQIPDRFSVLGYVLIIGAALFRWYVSSSVSVQKKSSDTKELPKTDSAGDVSVPQEEYLTRKEETDGEQDRPGGMLLSGGQREYQGYLDRSVGHHEG